MKDKERDKFFLNSIFDETRKIENFAKGITYDSFLKDEKLQYAVYKAFENIGEASKNISKETKEKYSEIPWKELAGLRDKLTHGYFGIDIERIWKTIQERIPVLKSLIVKLIGEEK